MSKKSFRDLFDERTLAVADQMADPEEYKYRADAYLIHPLEADLQLAETTVICYLSLTCASCITLIPELSAFASTFAGQFMMLCNGTPEENAVMASHFQFPFPVLTINRDDARKKYGLVKTPMAVRLKNGIIEKETTVFSAGQLALFALEE
ncbi:hypothetical protein ACFQZE_04835 [Paenibacillus sp. GCM10027627]|uniref:hypothetical protein n=1 Tax=unclassified Paenibacillus TaxID=185978 RepID=UPI0036400AF8